MAVLPFPPGETRHGFTDDERKEFDELLNRAEYWINAPALAGLDDENDEKMPRPDEEYFLAAGQYVANASHILISAWDGVDISAVGGTADITRYRLNMRPLRIAPLSLEAIIEEWKLLLVVPTQREGQQVPPGCLAGWYTSESVVLKQSSQFDNARDELKSLESFCEASASIGAANRKAVVAENDLGQLYEVADNLATTNVKWLRKHWRSAAFKIALLVRANKIATDAQPF